MTDIVFPTASASKAKPAYRYWAFISYAHHDSRIAQTLKRRLAAMRVPAELRAGVGAGSATFSDVFLDVHDAGADRSVSAELEEALAASRYLVVICSPISRQSIYVNEEIRYFLRMGRSQDILCFVGYGVPGAAAAGQHSLECLPLALEEAGDSAPLAAVIGMESEQEWDLAVAKIAAGLSGRSLKDYRRALSSLQMRNRGYAALAVGVLLALAYGLLWAYYLPNVSYATAFARKDGLWVPVQAVAADRAARLDRKYRFISAGAFGRLRRVELVNRFNRCEGPLESITGDSFSPSCSNVRVCAAEFNYIAGKVKEEKLLDQYGNAVETLNYLRPSTAAISEAIIGCTFRPGTIAVVKFERHQSGTHTGLDKKITFWGLGGAAPAPNADHVYGFELAYDEAGRANRVTTLDEAGMPKTSRKGYASKVMTVTGKEVSEAYFDAGGKPVTSSNGFHRQVEQLDSYGDLAGVAYFDLEGQPTNGADGFHRYSIEWLAGSREAHLRFFDKRGAATSSKTGAAAKRRKFDDAGQEIEGRYYDSAGKLVIGGSRYCAIERTVIDKRSGQETASCFDHEDRPAFDRYGVHAKTLTYNSKGQVLEVSDFGINRQPVFCNDNGDEVGCPVHRMVNQFDEAGNRIRVRFYAPDGSLSANGEGLAGWNSAFTPSGLERHRLGIGLDGKASPNKEGVTATEYAYDKMSRLVSQRFLDARGRPVPNGKGIYRYVAHFGEDELTKVHMALGLDGKVMRDEAGIGVTKYTANVMGRVTAVHFYDVDGKTPVAERDGWFGIARDYDAYGNIVKNGRLGKTGLAEPGKGGLSAYVSEYDAVGRIIAESSVGASNELLGNATGIATRRLTYHLGKTIATEKTYDIGGHPASNQDGIAILSTEINRQGQVIKTRRYGPDGVPQGEAPDKHITAIVQEYDERGRQVTKRFFDRDGKPAANSDHIFGVRYIHDAKNFIVEEISLGPSGDPLDLESYPARMKYAYDAFGRNVLMQQMRADGTPAVSGVPRVYRIAHDSYGRVIKRQFEDARGLVLHRESGRAIIRYEHDAFGRLVGERSYDTQDALVNRKDVRWATRTWTYNEFGEGSVTCTTVTGAPVLPCHRYD